ncbi:RNA-guided endonuclease TnpB family protein [Deltaproteobacteria bacterium TL4]
MLISHKIALDPNNQQSTYFAKASGVARFAYNWALTEWKAHYEAGLKPTETSLRRQLNSIKAEQFPWMLEVTKNAPQMAIIHLGNAFQNFFAGRSQFPTFKKKGIHDSFSLTNDQFRVKESFIQIPKLGWVKMHESLRFPGKLMSATISRVANRWFVSLTVESEIQPVTCENQAVVGVDLGLKAQATLSTGETLEGPKPHRVLLKRLRRLSRSLSNKQKGSKNRSKAKRQLSRLHARIANIRQDALHKLTTDLTQRFGVIVIEDLNVKGMMKNRHLSRSVADMGFFEFRRQLEYKAAMHGNRLVVADRWFASSKTCAQCHYKLDELPLSMRQWTCPSCGTQHDRDVNAARNLEQVGRVPPKPKACGEVSADVVAEGCDVKLTSMKQEFNVKRTYG